MMMIMMMMISLQSIIIVVVVVVVADAADIPIDITRYRIQIHQYTVFLSNQSINSGSIRLDHLEAVH